MDKFDRELIHEQYVKVVEAYSVLGKVKEREQYDFRTGIKTDPDQFQTSRTGEAGAPEGRERRGNNSISGDSVTILFPLRGLEAHVIRGEGQGVWLSRTGDARRQNVAS